jgi:hypothetical protein
MGYACRTCTPFNSWPEPDFGLDRKLEAELSPAAVHSGRYHLVATFLMNRRQRHVSRTGPVERDVLARVHRPLKSVTERVAHEADEAGLHRIFNKKH